MTQMMTYHRPDGAVGCGYKIEWAGIEQHSVSWPDGPAQRYRDEDLDDRKIKIKSVAVVRFGDRKSIEQVDENGGEQVDAQKEPVNAGTDSGEQIDTTVEVNKTLAEADEQASDSFPLEAPADTVDTSDESVENAASDKQVADQTDSQAGNTSRFDPSQSEAANIRIALEIAPEATNRDVIDHLHAAGISVSSSQVSRERKTLAALVDKANQEAAEQEGQDE